MRILVVSDTHRQIQNVLKIMKQLKDVDRIIHLGDMVGDAQDIESIFQEIPLDYVAGNCDFFEDDIPADRYLKICDKKFLITHGHNHGVKRNFKELENLITKENLEGLFFGHTHMPHLSYVGQAILMNPGSITEPRGSSMPTYGLLEIDYKGEIHTTINFIK